MYKPITCNECQLGRKVSLVGNGITEPPFYITVIECPFEKEYYMDKYCNCKHESEREQSLYENNHLSNNR